MNLRKFQIVEPVAHHRDRSFCREASAPVVPVQVPSDFDFMNRWHELCVVSKGDPCVKFVGPRERLEQDGSHQESGTLLYEGKTPHAFIELAVSGSDASDVVELALDTGFWHTCQIARDFGVAVHGERFFGVRLLPWPDHEPLGFPLEVQIGVQELILARNSAARGASRQRGSMIKTLLFAVALTPSVAQARLVAWFPLDGTLKERLQGTVGEFKGDASFGKVDQSRGALFGGQNGVVFFPDQRQFWLGPSFSVSATVWVNALPRGGTSPQGQIVFRGDDRGGLDNYSLNLGEDGYYNFNFYGASNDNASVRVPARLGVWQTLLGTFDAKTRQISLYLDGVLVAQQYTSLFPVMEMTSGDAPGFSIGNVQNPLGGCHNQPFNGTIRDVRLFDSVASWDDLIRVPLVGSGGR